MYTYIYIYIYTVSNDKSFYGSLPLCTRSFGTFLLQVVVNQG